MSPFLTCNVTLKQVHDRAFTESQTNIPQTFLPSKAWLDTAFRNNVWSLFTPPHNSIFLDTFQAKRANLLSWLRTPVTGLSTSLSRARPERPLSVLSWMKAMSSPTHRWHLAIIWLTSNTVTLQSLAVPLRPPSQVRYQAVVSIKQNVGVRSVNRKWIKWHLERLFGNLITMSCWFWPAPCDDHILLRIWSN